MNYFLNLLILLCSLYSQAQTIQLLDSGYDASFRGLSVFYDNLFWVSGSNGTVGVSYDAGKTIQYQKIKGFETRDFRDIHIFSPKEIIIMAIGNPAVMLKTFDSGHTWQKVFERDKEGMFLDAFDFAGKKGYCIGDPIDEHFFLLKTVDKGNTWALIKNTPKADSGEACFASSGTNIVVSKKGFAFVSGGLQSHFYSYNGKKFIKDSTNFSTGSATSGANSLYKNKNNWYIVGGDFNEPKSTKKTFYYLSKNNTNWYSNNHLPYNSCILKTNKRNFIACGLSDIAYNLGDLKKWQGISTLKFHVIQKSQHGHAIYLAGGGGKIGKFIK